MFESFRDKLREFFAEAGVWWSGVRLQVLGFLAFILGLLELVDPYALSYILPERWSGVVTLGIGAAIFLLRKVIPPPESKDDDQQ